jgi:hypothetical protein
MSRSKLAVGFTTLRTTLFTSSVVRTRHCRHGTFTAPRFYTGITGSVRTQRQVWALRFPMAVFTGFRPHVCFFFPDALQVPQCHGSAA